MLKNGTYVRCSCEGCMLRGNGTSEPDLFAGTLTNHGVIDYVDPVTNCYNVYAFLKELLHRKTKGEGALIIVLGIVQFVNINNAYGYEIGNQVLRLFSELICAQLPGPENLFRLDGSKFALVLPVTMQDQAQELFQKILNIAEQQMRARC